MKHYPPSVQPLPAQTPTTKGGGSRRPAVPSFAWALAFVVLGFAAGVLLVPEIQRREVAELQEEARANLAATKRDLIFAQRLRREAEEDAREAARWRWNAEQWAREARAVR